MPPYKPLGANLKPRCQRPRRHGKPRPRQCHHAGRIAPRWMIRA